jgi:hypothetical protein
MLSAIIYFAEPDSAELDGPILEIGCSRTSRNSGQSSESMTIDPDDWRTHLVCYLENPGHIADRTVQRQTLKYVILDTTLYR